MQLTSVVAVAAALAVVNAAPALEKRAEGGVVSGDGLQWYDSDLNAGSDGEKPSSTYKCFTGPASAFPAKADWMKFESAWTMQKGIMEKAGNGNKPEEYGYMHDAIVQVSKDAKVDARVILAMIMQESGGKIRVDCTSSNEGVRNCGLLQAFQSSPFDASKPKDSITQMIKEGIQGTPQGPGLAQDINESKAAGNVYNALRIYNSGIVAFNAGNLNQGGGATNTYVTDVANRLKGWDGSGGEDARKNCH